MRSSGCLNLVVTLLAASVATALTAVSVVLFLSFAALSFGSSTGIETILRTVVALIAGYFFIRVGLSIWRDLKGHQQKVGSGRGKGERGSAGKGER
jgi:hypothetical protein